MIGTFCSLGRIIKDVFAFTKCYTSQLKVLFSFKLISHLTQVKVTQILKFAVGNPKSDKRYVCEGYDNGYFLHNRYLIQFIIRSITVKYREGKRGGE